MSIRIRLTLWYTGILAMLLLLFGVSVYFAVSYILLRQIDEALANAASEMVRDSTISLNQETMRPVVNLPGFSVFQRSNIYAEVIDPSGKVRLASQSLGENFEQALDPLDWESLKQTPVNELKTSAFINTAQHTNAPPLRVYTRPLIQDSAGQTLGYLQVAMSLEEVENARRGLVLALGWSGGISVLLSALVGVFTAWRALRPVDRITQTAREILQTGDLDRRVPMRSTPTDEVGRLALAFNDMIERLSRLFRAQQRLVADVSHELRTPLTIIRGNLDLMRAMGCSDFESLDAMTREADRMTRMVSNILLLSQVDAGVLPMQKQPLELAPLISDVERSARVLANDRVKIVANICGNAQVLGDADRLKQVFLNLVENAIKHTPDGGWVSIDCDPQDAKTVRIAVSDTGIGIPAEDLPHVFERFYRVDKSRTRMSGGAGLGLSIAQSIVHTHGGQMSVRSSPGKGTTFEIVLPAYQKYLTSN